MKLNVTLLLPTTTSRDIGSLVKQRTDNTMMKRFTATLLTVILCLTPLFTDFASAEEGLQGEPSAPAITEPEKTAEPKLTPSPEPNPTSTPEPTQAPAADPTASPESATLSENNGDAVALLSATEAESNPAPSPILIAAFDELDEAILYQEYFCGEIASQNGLPLPDALMGTDIHGNPVEMSNFTWESKPAFSPDLPGEYAFSPELLEGFALAEGVEFPVVTVRLLPVEAMGAMAFSLLSLADYDAGDIAVINGIIASNGLAWEEWTDQDEPPHGWQNATWNNDNPKHITRLAVNGQNLYGALDVSILSALEELNCANNGLTALDVSGCAALERLHCQNNRLAVLDMVGFAALSDIDCGNNPIEYLRLPDGKDLHVNVDDPAAGNAMIMMTHFDYDSKYVMLSALPGGTSTFDKWVIDGAEVEVFEPTIGIKLEGSTTVTAHYRASEAGDYAPIDVVAINAIIDNNNLPWTPAFPADGSIVPADWAGVKWSSEATGKRIIELDISGNSLTGTLNVSSLIALKSLICRDNNLTALNLSGLRELNNLNVDNNNLATLNVTGLTSLSSLSCTGNKLSTLNLAGINGLNSLYCDNNNLRTLDVSKLAALTELSCNGNGLTTLNVSSLAGLRSLSCANNNLSVLNVSSLTALERLSCADNNLSSLNVAGLTSLEYLYCYGNNLSSLNVAGSNVLIELSCDDNTLSTLNVSDLAALDRLSCSNNNLNALDVSGLAALSYLDCSNNKLSQLDASGLSVLRYLNASRNRLSALDVSGFVNLREVDCSFNKLSELLVAGCTALESLWCQDNNLSTLDVSDCANLQSLNCAYNNLGALDASACAPAISLNCENNPLSRLILPNGRDMTVTPVTGGAVWLTNFASWDNTVQLIVRPDRGVYFSGWTLIGATALGESDAENPIAFELAGTVTVTANMQAFAPEHYDPGDIAVVNEIIGKNGLRWTPAPADGTHIPTNWNGIEWSSDSTDKRVIGLDIGSKGLTGSLDVSGLEKLVNLRCEYNSLTALNVSGLEELVSIACFDNNLGTLNITGCVTLKDLTCQGNRLRALDVSGFVALETLICYANNLLTLNVNGCAVLAELFCQDNNIAALDISNCIALKYLDCENNSIDWLDVSGCPDLETMYCSGNPISLLTLLDGDELNLAVLPAEKGQVQIACNPAEKLITLTALGMNGHVFDQWAFGPPMPLSDEGDNFVEFTLPSGAAYVSAYFMPGIPGTYNTGDVAAINRMIDNNGLRWTKAPANGSFVPIDWQGVEWSSDFMGKRIIGLSLPWQADLTGSLNLSGMTALTSLVMTGSRITTLNVSGCAALETLECDNNEVLSTLTLTGCASLQSLSCNYNMLGAVNLSASPELEHLSLAGNRLATLNVSACLNLEYLNCGSNNIKALDVSGLNMLNELYCHDNPISNLRLPGDYGMNVATAPTAGGTVMLLAYNHASKEVELAAVPAFGKFFEWWAFSGLSPEPSSTDKTVSFTLLEATAVTATSNFRSSIAGDYSPGDIAVINRMIDRNSLKWTKAPVNGSSIPANWTGVVWSSDDTNRRIEMLDVGGKALTGALDMSGLTQLKELYCRNNNLTGLNVSGCANLSILDAGVNKLSELDLSDCSGLFVLYCDSNNLHEINVSKCYWLNELRCHNNPMSRMQLGGGYEMNAGSMPTSGGTVMLTAYDHAEKSVELTAVANTGYRFDGWQFYGSPVLPGWTDRSVIGISLWPGDADDITAKFASNGGLAITPSHAILSQPGDTVGFMIGFTVTEGADYSKITWDMDPSSGLEFEGGASTATGAAVTAVVKPGATEAATVLVTAKYDDGVGIVYTATATVEIVPDLTTPGLQAKLLEKKATVNKLKERGTLVPILITNQSDLMVRTATMQQTQISPVQSRSTNSSFIVTAVRLDVYNSKTKAYDSVPFTAEISRDDDRYIEICADDSAKTTKNVRVRIELAGGVELDAGTIDLTVVEKYPKITITAESLDLFYPSRAAKITGKSDDGVCSNVMVTSWNVKDVSSGRIKVNPFGDQISFGDSPMAGTYKFSVSLHVEGYKPGKSYKTQPTVSVKAVNATPKLKLTASTITLANGAGDASLGLLSADGKRTLDSWGEIVRVTLNSDATNQYREDGKINIPGSTSQGNHVVNVWFKDALKPVVLKLTVKTIALDKVTIASKTKAIVVNTNHNTGFPIATVDIQPNAANVLITDLEVSQLFDLRALGINCDIGVNSVTFMVADKSLLNVTQKPITVEIRSMSYTATLSKPVKISLSITSKSTACSVALKGKLDIANLESVITATVNMSNTTSEIDEVILTDYKGLDCFRAFDYIGNTFKIRLDGSNMPTPGMKYSVKAEIKLVNGDTLMRDISITPSQTVGKAYQSTKEVTLYKATPLAGAQIDLDLLTPVNAVLGNAIISKQSMNTFKTGQGFILERSGEKSWVIKFEDTINGAIPAKGTPKASYSLKLELWADGTYVEGVDGVPTPLIDGKKQSKPTVITVKVNVK